MDTAFTVVSFILLVVLTGFLASCIGVLFVLFRHEMRDMIEEREERRERREIEALFDSDS